MFLRKKENLKKIKENNNDKFIIICICFNDAIFNRCYWGYCKKKYLCNLYVNRANANGITLFLVTFARYHFNLDAQVMTVLIIAIAAAEAAIFLSVIILLFRSKKSLDTDVFTTLTQGEKS